MHTRIVTVLLAVALAPPLLAAEKPDPLAAFEANRARVRSLVAKACEEMGLPFERLGYRHRDLVTMRDAFRLEHFDAWMAEPLLFKEHCDTYCQALRGSVERPQHALRILTRLNDVSFYPTRRGGDPAGEGDPAARCRKALTALLGEEAPAREKQTAAFAAALPAYLQAALADYLDAVRAAVRHFRAAFNSAGLEDAEFFLGRGKTDWYDRALGAFRQPVYDFCRRLDMATVLLAGLAAARAAQAFYAKAAKLLAGENAPTLAPATLETPYGKLVVGSAKDDRYPAGRYFLILDPAGNDTYGAGAGGAAFGQYVSLCIDLAGNDTYKAAKDEAPSFGAGYFGAGFLFDRDGDDEYEAWSDAQGFAAFGAGLLWDGAGSDRYVIRWSGQGMAYFGTAALLDRSGDDRYVCFHLAQGVGRTRGTAALVDGGGDDRYTARDDEIIMASPQSRKHNSSLAQGCGYGRRADMSDGHSVSGGIGILIDGGGSDTYAGGVMAQAHGYWYGAGILVDYGGEDSYQAAWYGQSTSAHFGLSYLRDHAGDDKYHTLISQNLGNGRDLSVSIFEDDLGDDTYTVVDRGGGCGNINGIGIFLDLAGEDRYTVRSRMCLGRGDLAEARNSMLRRAMVSVGIFLDGGGKDIYAFPEKRHRRARVGNGAAWLATKNRYEFSIGWDRE